MTPSIWIDLTLWLFQCIREKPIQLTHTWLFSDIKITYHKSSLDPVLDEHDFLSAIG